MSDQSTSNRQNLDFQSKYIDLLEKFSLLVQDQNDFEAIYTDKVTSLEIRLKEKTKAIKSLKSSLALKDAEIRDLVEKEARSGEYHEAFATNSEIKLLQTQKDLDLTLLKLDKARSELALAKSHLDQYYESAQQIPKLVSKNKMLKTSLNEYQAKFKRAKEQYLAQTTLNIEQRQRIGSSTEMVDKKNQEIRALREKLRVVRDFLRGHRNGNNHIH